MSARLDAALAELAAAIRDEITTEIVHDAGAPERLWSIPEAAEALSIGRTLIYREMDAKRLRSIKVGRRRLIPASALAAYTGESR
jgi:excisionase family DNA binding protein